MSDITDPNITALFEEEGRKHLQWLEYWSTHQRAEVAGANVLQALTYDLVQLMNNAFLRGYLGSEDNG
jgi:hypothetical protein